MTNMEKMGVLEKKVDFDHFKLYQLCQCYIFFLLVFFSLCEVIYLNKAVFRCTLTSSNGC